MKPIFSTVNADEIEQEVTQKDQFNTDEVTLAETLIRESLQNSNDARPEGGTSPVRIRLDVKEPDSAHAEFWGSLLEQLDPHLKASDVNTNGLDYSMPRVLVVEDFGTTGLTGSVDSKDNSNFQDFWRRVGRSHKGGDKSGSWGLGKIVFPASSRIRTFMGLTVRHDDPDKTAYLMGQTVLKHHKIGSVGYSPIGLISEANEEGFRVPVTNHDTIESFKAAASVTRKNEPGLSIAIPFVGDDIKPATLIPFVVKNYFFPILTGQLEVEIGEEKITSATLESLAKTHGGPALENGHLLAFIKQIQIARSKKPDFLLPENWTSANLAECLPEETLKVLRQKYIERSLVHVRVPMSLFSRLDGEKKGTFDLFVQLSPEGVQGAPLFVRGSITVPGEAHYFPSRQAFAALVASEGPVSAFLRDAENPAHTRWNGQAEKLADKWKKAGPKLSQIRNSLHSLYDVLAQSVDRVEEDALLDILSIKDSGATKNVTKRDEVIKRPFVPKLEPKPKMFSVSKTQNGFVVKSGKGLEPHNLPLNIRIRAGYDLLRGNPFTKHSPFDFDFSKPGDIVIINSGAIHTAVSSNELLIEANEAVFEVKVEGFDTRRDLKVKATR